MIFIDDMGWGDLGCYGNPDIKTPNIDTLAAEGIRFEQFYVASPICSPSRVAVTTGQFPARHKINSYLNSRAKNAARGMVNFLDPSIPAVARHFQSAGYATAHFGKWHMGGGRDVDDAPLPQAYGFQESLVSFEGLGDRILQPNNHGLSAQSAKLGHGKITYVEKHKNTETYVNRSIDFISRHQREPFYLHLWLNDVHDPFKPTQLQLDKYSRFSKNKYLQQYYAVMDEMDQQLGRLFDHIDESGLEQNTIIIVCADNGPTAWPRYKREGFDAPGWTGGLRGRKWSLYEGGIREPLIIRWPGKIKAGSVSDHQCAHWDLMPTLCELAGIDTPKHTDGISYVPTLTGADKQRAHRYLYWEFHSYGNTQAIRMGDWKALRFKVRDNPDAPIALYNLKTDIGETKNIADQHPDVVKRIAPLFREAHTPSENFPLFGRKQK